MPPLAEAASGTLTPTSGKPKPLSSTPASIDPARFVATSRLAPAPVKDGALADGTVTPASGVFGSVEVEACDKTNGRSTQARTKKRRKKML